MLLEERLQTAGFSHNEAKIYVALLNLGKARLSDIARKAGLNHVLTLYKLRKLAKKRLVVRVKEGKQIYHSIQNPKQGLKLYLQNLKNELNEKDTAITESLEAFEIMYANIKNRPEVKFVEGEDTTKALHLEIENTKFDELLEFTNLDQALQYTSAKQKRQHRQKMKQIRYTSRSIYTSSKGETLPRKHKTHYYLNIPNNIFFFEGEIVIFGDKTALIAANSNNRCVIIKEASITKTMKGLFDWAWYGVRRYLEDNKMYKDNTSLPSLRTRMKPRTSFRHKTIPNNDSANIKSSERDHSIKLSIPLRRIGMNPPRPFRHKSRPENQMPNDGALK